MTSLDILLESGSSGSTVCEHCDTVSVSVAVDQLDGVLEGVDVEADENGSKDLFLVAFHRGGDIGEDCWADLYISYEVSNAVSSVGF